MAETGLECSGEDSENDDSVVQMAFESGEGRRLSISLVDIPADGSFESLLWPSAFVLSQYILENSAFFRGKSVLELGCGRGLPGIVAAVVGASSVVLSDRWANESDKKLLFCQKASRLNGVASIVSCSRMPWGVFDWAFFQVSRPDIIIGADLMYDKFDFEPLFATLDALFAISPGCAAILAYHKRTSDFSLLELVKKWNFVIQDVPSASIMEKAGVYGDIWILQINRGEQYI